MAKITTIWRPTTWINVVGLLLLYWFFAYRFNLSLIFDNTILTGGDSISWYQVALHMRDSLLPHGRLFGWNLDNFFGYSNFQSYFIPPFLLAVLLSYLIPLTVALKFISVLGVATTPLATFYLLKKFRYPDPLPLAGSWLVLLFLFNEHYDIFGGNIPSMLAGEFCFSIAFTLQILFIGTLHDTMQHNRRLYTTSALLACIGLTHAFVFFTALFFPLYYVFKKDFSAMQLRYLLQIYLFAFLLMAFWLIPMLANREFVVSILMVWHFFTWAQFSDQFWGELLLLSLFAAALVIFKPFRRYHASFYLFGMAVSLFLYLASPLLKVPDIRFVPPFLLFCFLLILDNLACIAAWSDTRKRQHTIRIATLVFIFAIASLFVSRDDLRTPEWFNWNYAGYEATPGFADGTMRQLQNVLRGDLSDGRVAWEQLRDGGRYGGARIFENLTLLTGRAGTEGINYGSSLLGKIITVMHSEYSPHATSPESIVYSHMNIPRLAERFRLFNITEFIANTPTTKRLLDASPDFSKRADVAEFSIYQVKPYRNQYVETPDYYPQLVTLTGSNWKKSFHAWFRRAQNSDVLLVNSHYASEASLQKYFAEDHAQLDASGIVSQLQRKPISPATISNTKMEHFRIRFTTDSPGKPHLIKVTYAPNWYSVNHEPILMVSPGLMLIFPETNQVELRYGRHWSEHLGYLLTLCGFGLILLLRFFKPALVNKMWNHPAYRFFCATIRRYRFQLVAFIICIAVLLAIMGGLDKQNGYPLLERAQTLASEKNYAQSIALLEELTSVENIRDYDDLYIPLGLFTLGETYLQTGNTEKAKQTMQKFIYYYPNWEYIDKVYFTLGNILKNENDIAGAMQAYSMCLAMQSESGYMDNCKNNFSQLMKRSEK